MQWNSLNEFIAMGGYGFYVWGSFGFTFALMAMELWLLRRRRQHVTNLIKNETV